MPKNVSEKKTIRISKNSFLTMYVFNNPNKKCIQTNNSDEFCDCLIHMANVDIIIQVKRNDEPNAKNWFVRKVLGSARKQLTTSYKAMLSSDYEIWNRKNNKLISKCSKKPNTVHPVIVFEKGDLNRYQQAAKYEKTSGTNPEYVGCNIFSIEDFEYATSMIPTGKDFIDYLTFRFKTLIGLEPEIQLYPLFRKDNSIACVNDVSSNEQILVLEFLHSKFTNFEKVLKNSIMWHENLVGLEKSAVNSTFIQLLSFLSMEDIIKWDKNYIELLKASKNKSLVWKSEPILTGFVEGATYGIMLSYAPIYILNNIPTNADEQIKLDALDAIQKYKLDAIFVFQYTNSKIVRLTKILK